MIAPTALHLTSREVEKLIRRGDRQQPQPTSATVACLLLSYRHGYPVSEICALPLDHVVSKAGATR